MKRFLILLALLLCAIPAWGQGAFFQGTAQKTVQNFVAPIPGATVTVCTAAGSGTPCTPTASIFLDAGLTQPAPNPLTADSNGNFSFYATAATTYKYSITATGVTGQLFTVVLPMVSGGAATFSSLTVSGINYAVGGVSVSGPACTVAGLQSALTSGTGGKVDATACTGTISTNITNATGSISVPLNTTLYLGPSLWTCTITTASTPCFSLAAQGAKLIGAGQGDTTSNSNAAGQTILQCSACGTTTDMIDIGAGTGIFRSVKVIGFKILMASSGRYGIYVIGGWHEGRIEDVAIYEAVSDNLHIEGGTGATYRSKIVGLLTEKGGGYGGRIQGSSTIVGEVAFLTFEDTEFDSAGITTVGGFRIDMPAGSISTAQLHNISFINCHFQPGDSGTHTVHSFDFTQAGSGQILNVGFLNSAFEVNPGSNAGALGISVSSVSATGIQGLQCLGCAFANVNAIHNIVNGSNVTDSLINVGPPAGTDYQISRLIVSGALSTTGQNSIEFNQSGQARTILYPKSDGAIGVRRQDTSQEILTMNTNNPADTASGLWPTLDNTYTFGRSNFRWSTAHTLALNLNENGACNGVAAGIEVLCADPTLHGVYVNANGGGISNFFPTTVALIADWTCGTGGTVASCTSATIIGSGGGVPLTFNLPHLANSFTLECNGVVGQATAVTANQWNLLTATNGATNVTATYDMFTAATTPAAGAVTDQASTTTTFQIAPSWTLGAITTKMPFHIWAKVEAASASGTVLSLQLLAPTVGDLVTIYRGTSCRIF